MPKWNGAVLIIAQIIKFVMTSASEAELGALFITAQALGGPKNEPPFKQITPQRRVWSTTLSCLANSKQWIDGFTGYAAEIPKDNSTTTGLQEA